MKKILGAVFFITLIFFCMLQFSVTASSNDEDNWSCDKPLQLLHHNDKNYSLSLISKSTSLEPGIKFGYVKCQNGQYTPTEEPYHSYILYHLGTVGHEDEIMIFGVWGRAIYTQ